MKISQLPLDDLYARKITTSVEAAIQAKDDFSKVNSRYCDTVCKMKCKAYEHVNILQVPVDVLIVQEFQSPDDKWSRSQGSQEKTHRRIIDFICREAGYTGLTYRVVNLLKCVPNEQDFPRGKAPTSTLMSKCKPYLFQEIANSKPKVILSLNTAVTKVLGLKGHSNAGNRGEIVDSAYGKVVISLHPKALILIRQSAIGVYWGSDYMAAVVRDFKKAADIARGNLVVPNLKEAVKFYVENRMFFARSLEDVRMAMDTLNALPPTQVVSFDTETTGLDEFSPFAKLLTIQFGWRASDGNTYAWVIPLWHRENKYYNADQAWTLIAPWIASERPKVGHNAKFDIKYILKTTGTRLRGLKFDTLTLKHGISSGEQGMYGLKAAVWDHLPHTGLGGYENLLPSLASLKSKPESDTEESETNKENYETDKKLDGNDIWEASSIWDI